MTPERIEAIRRQAELMQRSAAYMGDPPIGTTEWRGQALSDLLDEVAPPEPQRSNPRMRAKLFALVTHIGLTPDERAEITELVLGEPHSWSDLTDAQATRLLDSLEGWVHINQLIGMRA